MATRWFVDRTLSRTVIELQADTRQPNVQTAAMQGFDSGAASIASLLDQISSTLRVPQQHGQKPCRIYVTLDHYLLGEFRLREMPCLIEERLAFRRSWL
jgi:hypothetical protein